LVVLAVKTTNGSAIALPFVLCGEVLGDGVIPRIGDACL
jgi:hypothetical protein